VNEVEQQEVEWTRHSFHHGEGRRILSTQKDPLKKDPLKKDPLKKDPLKKDPLKKDPLKNQRRSDG